VSAIGCNDGTDKRAFTMMAIDHKEFSTFCHGRLTKKEKDQYKSTPCSNKFRSGSFV
jgi:hypothetical protein